MNRLKTLRISREMSQAQLGRILNCSDVTVSRYETGQRDIDSATICRLCEIFDVTADYLLGRSPLPKPELSDEETELLLAWRRSDERARAMVAVALQPFKEDATGSRAV